MANRISKKFMLSEKNLKYVEEVKDGRDLKYVSDALEVIINEHRESGDRSVEYLVKIISEQVAEKIGKDFSNLKKISNHSDKNVAIIIEMLNGMFFKMNYKEIVPTSEEICPGLKIAIQEVDKRIQESRTKKLDSDY